MKRIRLINLILIMFCCCNMLAQNITVTGQVVDVTSTGHRTKRIKRYIE